VEVLGHEAGHIGPERPIAPGAAPFLGEPEAEAKAKETVRRIYLEALVNAALELDGIRRRLMPDAPMGEPDLTFVAKVAAGDAVGALRSGFGFCGGGRASRFGCGTGVCVQRQDCPADGCGQEAGFLVDLLGALPGLRGFRDRPCYLQERGGLEPTGKLDRSTLAHLRAHMAPVVEFPRNFGVVVDGLYRGRQPDDIGQLAALKDKLGVRRVVTLNDDGPPVADWCRSWVCGMYTPCCRRAPRTSPAGYARSEPVLFPA